jgi:dipeptidyl aminopeptidase/acylaminoacyl peptidase
MNESLKSGRCLAVRDVVSLYSFHEAHGSCFAFSPDGTKLAYCVQRPLADASHYCDMFLAGVARSVLYTVELATLHVSKVESAEDCFAPAWSPCGNYLAFGTATPDAIQLTFMDMGTREQFKIPQCSLQLSGMRPYEWIGDGLLASVVVPDGGRPWLLGIDNQGSRKAAAAWQALNVPGQTTSSMLESPVEKTPAIPTAAVPHEFAVYDVRSRVGCPVSGQEGSPRLVEFRRRFDTGHQAGLERATLVSNQVLPDGALVAVHEASGQALFLVEDGQGSRLVLCREAKATQDEIFRTNAHLQGVRPGKIHDLEYVDEQGKPRRVRLLLPPNHDDTKPAPAVLWVYPGAAPGRKLRSLHRLHDPSQFNLQLLAARGYIVIEPALPLPEDQEPVDMAMLVAAKVRRAIEISVSSGLVDRERLHVMGHSLGGWAVMSLLATTDLFKSGIALAGISNLISYHGSCDPRMRYDSPAIYGFAMAEMCERVFRMGGPPWADTERYVRNSPIFSVEQMKAPLMIVQGDQDYVPISQGEEMFSALSRLGRKARFVRYWGEGHVLGKAANIEDLWKNIGEWLDDH